MFHFIAERRLEPAVQAAAHGDIDDAVVVKRLRLIPRVGLGILVVIFGAMMYAARGI